MGISRPARGSTARAACSSVNGGGKADHMGGSIVGLRLSTFRGNVRLSVQQKCHLSNPGSYQMSTAPVVRFAAALDNIERSENVIAIGNSGTGKTHVALGLGLAACQRGMSVGFTTGAELLFEVFSQRYERGSILVTTNLPFDEWSEVFGSERLTGALLDRLTHHMHILEMNGDSYRLKGSRQSAAALESWPETPILPKSLFS